MALDATVTAAEAYTSIISASRVIKTIATEGVALFSTDTESKYVFNIKSLRPKYGILVQYENVTGLDQYAKDQQQDQLYDIAAEITALKTALVAVSDWLSINYPVDVNGYLLDRKFNFSTMTYTYRVFTALQLAPLVALLTTVSNSVLTE